MADEEKRIGTQEAISSIAAAVRKLSERIDNHDELFGAMAKQAADLAKVQEAHQKIFEGLQRAVAERTGGEPPAKPGPAN